MEQEPVSPESAEQIQRSESRFGNVPEIKQALEQDPANIIGLIDELYPDTPEHTNVVEIARVHHLNRILKVGIQHGEQQILAIFKPESGEFAGEKKRYGLESLAKREVAGWVVSDHFGFDLVPPTVIREISGERGALQLFVDPKFYRPRGQGLSQEAFKKQADGSDFYAMAALDAMILNPDRKTDNYLSSVKNPAELVAVDHGVAFHEQLFFDHELQGPLLRLTANQPPSPIPDRLLEKLEQGLQHEAALRERLQPYLPQQDIDATLRWARLLAEKKVFLSSVNYEQVLGKPNLV